jgi:hypothetical protein
MSTVIQLTDRSRYNTGLDRCQRLRFLQYHFGPTGYGITRKAQSIPLATGSYYHVGLAEVLKYVKAHDTLPPDPVVREAVAVACAGYDRVIAIRGLQDEGHRLETVAAEQKALIEGFIWAFSLSLLPWLHEQARLLSVEHDDTKVIGCTCGLGDLIGTLEEHEARDCEGIGFQFRLDIITEYRARPGVLAYWEFKGTGSTGERFDTQWETDPQFPLGAVMEQERLGHPIQEAWVIGLLKGRREGDTYNPETKRREGDLRQQSPLCYGYHRPANPPMEEADWQAEFEWKDEWGKGHRLPKVYQKRGVWTLKEALGDSQVSPSEFWCKWMPSDLLAKQIQLIGPLNISQVLAHDVIEELVAEEKRWKGILYDLYDALEQNGFDWTSEGYQGTLRRSVPRSWSCRRYGKRHECQMADLCFYKEGWQDPLGSGGYIVRRPHHQAELAQMEARGLTPPEGWAEDDAEGES